MSCSTVLSFLELLCNNAFRVQFFSFLNSAWKVLTGVQLGCVPDSWGSGGPLTQWTWLAGLVPSGADVLYCKNSLQVGGVFVNWRGVALFNLTLYLHCWGICLQRNSTDSPWFCQQQIFLICCLGWVFIMWLSNQLSTHTANTHLFPWAPQMEP